RPSSGNLAPLANRVWLVIDSQRSDLTIASTALRSSLVAFGPIFAHAMKVVPLARNHKISMQELPAGGLPFSPYPHPLRALGARRGGTAPRARERPASPSLPR